MEKKEELDAPEMDEDAKRDANATYERPEKKKKDPEKLKAINTLEQSAMPENIKPVLEAPDEQLEVEYVYGYRTFDCRANLRYNAAGNPVFMVAALGIVLD